jgi:hypothetical protein
MARIKSEVLGTVTAPSGALLLVDMGMLELWCHDRKPVMPPGLLDAEGTANANAGCDFRIDGPDAEKCGRDWDRQWHPRYVYDIPRHGIDHIRKTFAEFVAEQEYDATLTKLRARVTHRQRIADALEHGWGAGQVFFQGIEGFAFDDLPTDAPMRVIGERMGGRDGAVKNRWRWVDLEVRPGAKVAATKSGRAGSVLVDRARLIFADVDALGAWNHNGAIDGKADVVFWGRAAEEVSAAVTAPRLPNQDGAAMYGWEDLPDAEARRKADQVWRLKEQRKLMFAFDYRPHSHHHAVLRQARGGATESGTVEVGGATMCGFMTTWGDGMFPIITERDKDGNLVRVRVQLGDDERVKLLYDVMEQARTG